MATDLVCGMQVNEATAKNVSELAGKRYFFCGAGCKRKFDANPDLYLNSPRPAGPARAHHPHQHAPCAGRAGGKRRHLHLPHASGSPADRSRHLPQVRHGARAARGDAEEDTSELRDMTRRFWVSVAFTLPLLVITMSEFMPALNLHQRLGRTALTGCRPRWRRRWCSGAAGRFSCAAWMSFQTWNLNMFSLIGLGTGAAYLFSVVGLLFPGLVARQLSRCTAWSPLYFEAAAVDRHAGAAGAGARAARARANEQRDQSAARAGAEHRGACRSRRQRTRSASGRGPRRRHSARQAGRAKCPSMAW